MAAEFNWTWEQGEDLIIQMVYEVGADEDSTSPVDLSDFQFRMDIATEDSPPLRVLTFNSDDITGGGTGVDNVGPADNEVTMDSSGNISILVSRVHTLTGGKILEQMALGKVRFKYDMFLRNSSGLQHKFLKGVIVVSPSITQWV